MLSPTKRVAAAGIAAALIVGGSLAAQDLTGEAPDTPQVSDDVRTEVGPDVRFDELSAPSEGERLSESAARGEPGGDQLRHPTVPTGFAVADVRERTDRVPDSGRLIRSTETAYVSPDGALLYVIEQDATDVEHDTLRASLAAQKVELVDDVATIETIEFVQVIRIVDGGIVNVIAEKPYDDPAGKPTLTAEQVRAIAQPIDP